MKIVYSPIGGPDVPADLACDDARNTDYRFAESAVFASSRWQVSRHAYRKAKKLAQVHGLDFFDASGDISAVWMPTPDDRYVVAHRGEKIALTH